MSKEKKEPSGITLKSTPIAIRKFILSIQSEIKISKGVGQYSMEKTIYKIISEHPDFK